MADTLKSTSVPAVHGMVVVNPDGTSINKPDFLQKIDSVDANTTYIGTAQIGAATSSALWQIKRILTSGTITTIAWASGTDAFTNIWDNRVSLSYS